MVKLKVVAGKQLYANLQAEKERVVPRNGEYFKSEPLCAWQSEVARRGVIGATLVKSMYGWSVRYDSGIQNFGILAGARSGVLDGTLKAAVEWAKGWVAEDPTRRYAWVRESELGQEEVVES